MDLNNLPTAEQPNTTIEQAFFPTLHTECVENGWKVHGMKQEIIARVLAESALEINEQLQPLKAMAETLQAIPQEKITVGETQVFALVKLYEDAVYNHCKAALQLDQADDSYSNDAQRAASLNGYEYHQQKSKEAVEKLLRVTGKPHSSIALL